MTHLYVIRHAQPDGCKTEIIGLSPPDADLSPVWVSQAQWLRDRLPDEMKGVGLQFFV